MDRVTRMGGLIALALAACTSGGTKDGPAGLGRAVYSGPVRAIAPSPDGAWLAFLERCRQAKGQFLPPGTGNCDLRVVPAAGGTAARVASAVTTLPHGVAWHPQGGVLAALADYDYSSGAATLVVQRPGGPPERAAEGVTFYAFVPGSRGGGGTNVGAIAGGRFLLASPYRAGVQRLAGVERLTTFEFDPGWMTARGRPAALLRSAAAAEGRLFAVDGDVSRPSAVASATEEYGFAPAGGTFAFTVRTREGSELRLAAGGGRARALARGVRAFEFSRDGSAIAFIAGAAPGRQGDLHVAPVAAGGADRLLGKDVGEFRWAARAPRLAWLERYDARVRAGALGVGGPGLAPRVVAPSVSDYELSADGAHVAILAATSRGGFSVDLALAELDAPPGTKPLAIAEGVFGFAFSPDGRWLYYRTRCTRNGEACDVERVPATGPEAGAKPEPIARAAKSFEFDPRDPERLLVGYQRMDLVALDLAVWDHGKLVAVDQAAVPGTARFLGPDSRRLAYAVAAPKRAGVYVAELPR